MGDIIWTKHALERNKNRQVTQGWIEQTVNNPDSFSDLSDGKMQLRKKFGEQTVTAITARTDSGKYLILSAWVNPPNYGSYEQRKNTFRKQMRKASFVKKFWLTFRYQIGL